MFTVTWTPEYPDNAPHVGKTVVFVPNPEVFLGEDGSTTLGAVEGVIDTAGALKAKGGTAPLLLKWKPGLQYQVRLVGSGLHPFWFDVPAVDGGTLDLSTVVPSAGAALVPTQYAELDARIDVLEAAPPGSAPDATTTSKGVVQLAGDLGGTAAAPTVPGLAGKAATVHTHPAADISDSTVTGRAVVTAADAAAARTAIGAGTSSFSGTYADLSGKPTVFPPDPAAAQPVNAQTGTAYTLVASDAGKLVTLTNAAAITLTVPGSVFTAGQRVDVLVLGVGMVTAVGSGATVNGTPSLVSRAQYSAFSVVFTSATTAVVIGDLA